MPKGKTESVDDPDNPEWTNAMFARSKPASELPPEILNTFPKTKRGRPPSENKKEAISIRLDKDVLDFFRAGGEGWQARINDTLIEAMRAATNAGQPRRD